MGCTLLSRNMLFFSFFPLLEMHLILAIAFECSSPKILKEAIVMEGGRKFLHR